MKTLEKLLAEYKIRFKETEEIEPSNYPFDTGYFSETKKFDVAIQQSYGNGDFWIRNPYGIVYKDGIWATAKITEKPEKWVVERNEQHPMWEKCLNFLVKNVYRNNFRGAEDTCYFGTQGHSKYLLVHNLSQFITLDQWAELFLDEPKEGDWCLFWDNEVDHPHIGTFAKRGDCEGGGYYTYINDENFWFINCQKLSPELSEMLEKEIDVIKTKYH